MTSAVGKKHARREVEEEQWKEAVERFRNEVMPSAMEKGAMHPKVVLTLRETVVLCDKDVGSFFGAFLRHLKTYDEALYNDIGAKYDKHTESWRAPRSSFYLVCVAMECVDPAEEKCYVKTKFRVVKTTEYVDQRTNCIVPFEPKQRRKTLRQQ